MSQHVLRIGGREYRAEVKELTPDRAIVLVDDREYVVDLVQLGRRKVAGDAGRATAQAVPPSAVPIAPGGPPATPVAVPPPAPVQPPSQAVPAAAPPKLAASKKGEGGIVAPMPGLVLALKSKEGDSVQAGQTLLVMEAMKMENAITSPYAGTVSKIYVRERDAVGEGDLLVEVARPKMTTL